MSNFTAWVDNLFGAPVRVGDKPTDEAMTRALEEFEEARPQVHMSCNNCGKLTRELRLSNGRCEKCRGFKVIQGG